MKINPNDPANPIQGIGVNGATKEIVYHVDDADITLDFPGMSIRTELAARAMQGLLAKDGWAERIMSEKPDTTKALSIQIAAASVRMADLLIKELNKPNE